MLYDTYLLANNLVVTRVHFIWACIKYFCGKYIIYDDIMIVFSYPTLITAALLKIQRIRIIYYMYDIYIYI